MEKELVENTNWCREMGWGVERRVEGGGKPWRRLDRSSRRATRRWSGARGGVLCPSLGMIDVTQKFRLALFFELKAFSLLIE